MHFPVVKSKHILFAVVAAFACVMLALNIFSGSSAAAVFTSGDTTCRVPINSVKTDEKRVAISFDAAWGADKTEKILEILNEYNAKATFFLVGVWAEEYPETVKKITDAGMEIGLLSNTYSDMTKLSDQQIKLELETNQKALEDIIGYKPTLFRAPLGAYNDRLLNTAARLGLTTVQWSVDSMDWKDLKPIEMTDRILNRAKEGSIIVCHSNSTHILKALPVILDRLSKKGFATSSVGELIYKENYSVNKQGIQYKK